MPTTLRDPSRAKAGELAGACLIVFAVVLSETLPEALERLLDRRVSTREAVPR